MKTAVRDNPQLRLPIGSELIIDLFAGGGGASLGIEQGIGRAVDIAVNHDPDAIALHKANHPASQHFCESVFKVNPVTVTRNRPVGLLWASPDCTHHSKAKGGKPVNKKIRGLAWVIVKWARRVRPRAIMLENVEEFQDWGPLTKDGHPCQLRKGQQFNEFVNQIRRLGYKVEWRILRACDYGAPTIRKRLFMIARCDGLPIVWPQPTHGQGLLPYRTAAECIDWSIPCPSIFERKRPLAENTLRRIARGIVRFVLEDAQPFIVPLTHHYDVRGTSIHEPMRTVTGAHRGELALVAPAILVNTSGHGPGDVRQPLHTVTTGGHHALVAAFLAKHYGGNYTGPGIDPRTPVSTITAHDHHAVVAAHLLSHHGTTRRHGDLREPVPTLCAGGTHASLVAALMAPYYGSGSGKSGRDIREPTPTVTSKDRLQLVTVTIDGESYVLADIGMRMLQPRELFRAQGFPATYKIEGFTKTAQVRMCGNSVCPPVARAIVEANFRHEVLYQECAA